MLPFLTRCLAAPRALRRAAGAARRSLRRGGRVSGAVAPHAPRHAGRAVAALRAGGLACLMAPLLAPLPADPPGLPAAPAARAGGRPSTPPLNGLRPPATGRDSPGLGGTGLMSAEASITGFEARMVPEGGAPAAPRPPVVVPEPGSAALFGAGVLALLWARRWRRAASGLDGEGGGR